MTPIEYLRKNIEQFPDKLALSDTKINLTFRELEIIFKAIAAAIIDKVGNTTRQISIALLLDRNVYYIASMFTAWELGGYFIPLNNKWPTTVIDKIIGQCKPDVVICHKSGFYHKQNALYIEELKQDIPTQYLKPRQSLPSDLAYVIYTSGSTGTPKGVMITNHSYKTYVEWTKNFFQDYKNNEKLLITAELTFDITMGDIAFAFAFGTAIFVAPDPKNIASIVRIVTENQIDTFYSVPTTHNSFFNFARFKRGVNVNTLKLIISGGDKFSVELIKTIKTVVPKAHFYNVYGPTEVTINCFAIRLDNVIEEIEEQDDIPIGIPFNVIDAVIIDQEKGDVTNLEKLGVLYVTGPQVMLGYFNDEETSLCAFIYDPRYPEFNRKLYNTGDLAVKKSDGRFYLMGRVDDLVKIKGYRIHPNEVTTPLTNIDGIIEAATIAVEYSRGKKLISFVTISNQIDKKNIFEDLSQKIPDYMIPEDIFIIDKMPLNNSGKIDKLSLKRFYKEKINNR